MTSPTQRRHDEILGRLDALIDAVQSTTARDHLHRLLAEESAAERRDEPVDVTEEPPVGSQVTDRSGDVWERFDEANHHGWTCWDARNNFWGLASAAECAWFEVRKYAPLRLTTDADRDRVGLPVDTAPDVDPDERQNHPGVLWGKIDALTADVERLTRERDEAVVRAERVEERQATSSQKSKARAWDELVQHDIFRGVRPYRNQSWLDALTARLDERAK